VHERHMGGGWKRRRIPGVHEPGWPIAQR
jgi:hypothetical protein